MANTNCRKGPMCQQCGSEGPFNIVIETVAKIWNDGHGHSIVSDIHYDGSSNTICPQCEYEAPYRAFDPSIAGVYTVILRYPEYLNPDGDQYFTKTFAADSPQQACAHARQNAFECNLDRANAPEDFTLVSVLAGDVTVEYSALEDPLEAV